MPRSWRLIPALLLPVSGLLAAAPVPAQPEMQVAQVHQGPAPARGGRGSGSMGIGEGITQENQPTLERQLPEAREPKGPSLDELLDAEPQHGDNTSMEHRKRYDPERRRRED